MAALRPGSKGAIRLATAISGRRFAQLMAIIGVGASVLACLLSVPLLCSRGPRSYTKLHMTGAPAAAAQPTSLPELFAAIDSSLGANSSSSAKNQTEQALNQEAAMFNILMRLGLISATPSGVTGLNRLMEARLLRFGEV